MPSVTHKVRRLALRAVSRTRKDLNNFAGAGYVAKNKLANTLVPNLYKPFTN
jgi:hypothetical protein